MPETKKVSPWREYINKRKNDPDVVNLSFKDKLLKLSPEYQKLKQKKLTNNK